MLFQKLKLTASRKTSSLWVLVDNATGYPVYVDESSENVKFIFLPPNTTPVIQPMDQGLILVWRTLT